MTESNKQLTWRVVHMDYSELAKRETIQAKILDKIASEDWEGHMVEIAVSLHQRREDGNHVFYIYLDPVEGRLNLQEKVFVGTYQASACEGIFGVKLLQHFDLQQKLIDSCRRAERKA
jgi:hypothetical protein